MPAVPFRLQPFEPDPALAGLELGGFYSLEQGQLRLHYRLSGPLEGLEIPLASPTPQRRDELWQSTCFEAFLGMAGSEGYWELNLSPAGHWNLYRLDGYRSGLRPEPRCSTVAMERQQALDALSLDLELNLSSLVPAEAPLELSLTAVLQQRNGTCSYWALQHTGSEADFHRRDSFIPSGS